MKMVTIRKGIKKVWAMYDGVEVGGCWPLRPLKLHLKCAVFKVSSCMQLHIQFRIPWCRSISRLTEQA